eukprot:Opistho-2@83215
MLLSRTTPTAMAIGRLVHTTARALAHDAPVKTIPSAPASIKKIGVIGAGQMGIGIAQVAAQIAKVNVVVTDMSQQVLDKQLKFLASVLQKNVDKNKMTAADRDATLARITTATSLDALGDIDYAIEAVSEKIELKQSIFKTLDSVTPKHAILATNTSSISVTKIAASTKRPEQVLSVHFMNPVPVMTLVEVIPGIATSKTTLDTSIALVEAMGKTTAISQDMPGFIANRILMPYINEAVFCLQEKIGTREDIDKTMKLGTNVPMGPLQLADFIGLDTCLAIMRVLHGELGDSKYRPSPLLVKYVDAGWLGKKSGRGFYDYTK